MPKFNRRDTIGQFQSLVEKVYSLPDDRLYSIWDLLTQQQRFTMRALKGIRKQNRAKIKLNLLISLAWLMAIANRLHIDVEKEIWKRFPAHCWHCATRPCKCGKTKPAKHKKVFIDNSQKPKTLAQYQKMFEEIYPSKKRSLYEAGVHLAEEMGEVSEAVHNYLGQHKYNQFNEVEAEIADFVSCLFGVANSARINIALELEKIFYRNCHVCHKVPCVCGFTAVAEIET